MKDLVMHTGNTVVRWAKFKILCDPFLTPLFPSWWHIIWFLSLIVTHHCVTKHSNLVAYINSHFMWSWSWNLVWVPLGCSDGLHVAGNWLGLGSAGMLGCPGFFSPCSFTAAPFPCSLFMWLLSVWSIQVISNTVARLHMWWQRAPKGTEAEAAMPLEVQTQNHKSITSTTFCCEKQAAGLLEI